MRSEHGPSSAWPLALAGATILATAVSAIGPADRFTWFLESVPVLLGLPLVAVLWSRARLSDLLCGLLFLHALILVTGGHYTYAQVPLGDWARGWFGWQRNNYDKLGHLAQGFVPAILTREILLRWSPFRMAPRHPLLPVLCIAAPLAFSALYEIIEWQVAVAVGSGADAFLGSQGDVWDTQSDMGMCLVGAVAALLLLARWHDRSLAALGEAR